MVMYLLFVVSRQFNGWVTLLDVPYQNEAVLRSRCQQGICFVLTIRLTPFDRVDGASTSLQYDFRLVVFRFPNADVVVV